MEITVSINAPGLEQAILALANAMEHRAGATDKASDVFRSVYPESQAPEQQAQPQQQNVATQQGQAVQQPGVPTQATAQSTQQPAPPSQSAAAQSTVPTTTATYTMEQLAVAATQLVDAGRRNDLVNLLQAFGVQALTALPKEQYGAFATKLREMGAKL